MSNLTVKDKKERILFEAKNGRCIIARFLDMSQDTKDSLIELYVDLTGGNGDRVRKFLNFESEEQEFCS